MDGWMDGWLVSVVPGAPLLYDWVPCHCEEAVFQPQVLSLSLLDSICLWFFQQRTYRTHRFWSRGQYHTCVCTTTTDTTQTSTTKIPYTHERRRIDRPKHPTDRKLLLLCLLHEGRFPQGVVICWNQLQLGFP